MRAFRNVSIRRQLTLIIMLTTSIALSFACLAFVAYEHDNVRHDIRRYLSVLAGMTGGL